MMNVEQSSELRGKIFVLSFVLCLVNLHANSFLRLFSLSFF